MKIDKYNENRIKDDACIAHDALESLMYANKLTPEYIKEKLDVVRNCVNFISYFEK